jgi:hypothetical protein
MLVATVLYEDSMQPGANGAFPPHDFVLSMVRDITKRELWDLRKLIEKNPRNGLSKVLADVRRTRLLAGQGLLCLLVDRDRVAQHLNLPNSASDDEIVEAVKSLSDARDKLSVHFLYPHMEGLLHSIGNCAGESAPDRKRLSARDSFLNRAAFSLSRPVRDCVKLNQAGLAALVDVLVDRLS